MSSDDGILTGPLTALRDLLAGCPAPSAPRVAEPVGAYTPGQLLVKFTAPPSDEAVRGAIETEAVAVNSLLARAATSAGNQKQNVDQVTTGVADLSKTTQDNAASAEEYLIEPFVAGVEATCGVLERPDGTVQIGLDGSNESCTASTNSNGVASCAFLSSTASQGAALTARFAGTTSKDKLQLASEKSTLLN